MTRVPACLAIVAGCSAGGGATIALNDAPAAYCARSLACYTLDELAARFPGASPAITDQASCRTYVARVFGDEFVADTMAAEAAGSARYHGDAMASCVSEIRAASCADLSRALAFTTLPATCPAPREPLVADGGACDHDFHCISALCATPAPGAAGTCQPVPAIGAACTAGKCGPDGYCDRSGGGFGTCTSIGDVGAACVSALACTSLDCQGGTCVAPVTCVGA